MARHTSNNFRLVFIFVAFLVVFIQGFQLNVRTSRSLASTRRLLVTKAVTVSDPKLSVSVSQSISTQINEAAYISPRDRNLEHIRVCDKSNSSQFLDIKTAVWDDFFPIVDLRLCVFLSDRENHASNFRVKVCKKMLERRDRGAVCIVARSQTEEDRGSGFLSPPGVFGNDENRRDNSRGILVGSLECSYHEFDTCKGKALGSTNDAGRRLYITEVAVDCRARRRGVGRALLEQAIEQARLNGHKTLYLHVDVANDAALRLYHRAGFRALEETKTTRQFTADLGLTSGDFAAANYLLMSRRLDANQPELPLQESAYVIQEDPFEHLGSLRPEICRAL